MRTMNVSLPPTLHDWVREVVATSGYGNVSEYVRELIRRDRKEREAARQEDLLREGLSPGPLTDLTRKDWDEIRKVVERRAKAGPGKAADAGTEGKPKKKKGKSKDS
jgi:antitoxin ParD1/3/4